MSLLRRGIRRKNTRLVYLPLFAFVLTASILLSFLLHQNDFSRISWAKTASDSEISVLANDGAFTNDVKMTVEKIDNDDIATLARRASGLGSQDVFAYNITFTDKDGKEKQPTSRVKVTINPQDYNLEAKRYALVHISDNNQAEYLGKISPTSDGKISFYANSFSIYAIIPTRETDQQRYARYTYNYYVDGEIAYSQIVRDGDILNAPAAPSKEGFIFMGWYTQNDKVFNELNLPVSIPDSIQTDKTINLHARFADEIFSIIFYNPQGNVLSTKTGTTNDVVNTDEYRYEVSAGYFVDAWTTDSSVMDYYDVDVCDHQCNVPDNITIPNTISGNITINDDNIKLYPIVRSVKWVHYHTNDEDADAYTAATYTPSDYAFYGQTISRPANPTRNGYDFDKWYTDPECTQAYDFSTPMTHDINLYAKWIPHTNTRYRIIFWKEALVDGRHIDNTNGAGNYEYAAYIDGTGTSGSTITVTQAQINQIMNQTEFKYYDSSTIRKEDNVVLHGDGSTIVNVYLSFKVYTVKFIAETKTTSGGRTQYCLNYYRNNTTTTSCKTTTLFDNGLVAGYTNGSNHDFRDGYQFDAVMGELISDRYPGTGQVYLDYSAGGINGLKAYAWHALNNDPDNTSRVSKPITMTTGLINRNNEGVTLYLVGALSTTPVTVNYWFEKADGSGYERSEDYSFEANVVGNGGNFNGRDVTGYTLLTRTPSGYSGSSGNTYNFYYDRIQYDLNFYNYNQAGESHQNIRHGASLTSYDYIPERPSGMSDVYTFQGWYTTPEYIDGTEFDPRTEVMPMSDLMLYAKWENTHYLTLSFNTNGGNAIAPQTVLYGNTARPVANPTRTGYTFVGWRKTDGTFFSFDNIITEDTQLVASWIPFDTIYIDYDPNGGTLVYEDDETYVDTSTTAILPAPTEAPAGKYFVGWNVNGRIYYPGNVVMILLSDIEDGSDTITIVAEWGKDVDKTSITYNPNTGMGSETSFVLEQNEAFTVKTATELNFTKTGYSLKDWNSEPDGSGVTYKPNTQWAADQRASLPNTLYAQWEVNCHTLTVRHILANGTQFDETETSEVCYGIHYETHASTKDGSYVGTVTSGVAEGDMPDNDVEVVYTYELRPAIITVRHLDTNGNQLAEPDTLPYRLGDRYTVNPKSSLVPYYDYTVDHATTGTVSGDLTITYTYTKKSFTLIVHHKNVDGTEFAPDVSQTYEYGDEYTATPISNPAYNHEVTSGSATGTISGNTEVTFTYTKKTFTITIHHIIEDAEDTTETKTVEYGTVCSATPRTDLAAAYDYVKTGDDCSGEVTGDITVTYTYTRKRFDLTIRHQKTDGTPIIADIVTHDHKYGDTYNNITADDEVSHSYSCTTTDPLSGTFTSDVSITFTCTKHQYTLTIHHINSDGSKFADDTTIGYEYGDIYTANPIVNDYYTSELTNGSVTGTITGDVEVTYTYTRKVATIIVHHVDENGNQLVGDTSFTKPYGETYQTSAATNIPDNYEYASRSENHTGIAETPTIEVTYHYQKKDPSLTTTIKIIDGDDTLSKDNQTSEYDIEYKANIGSYIGDSTITIVNTLPYPIDPDASDLAGGTYDEASKTITWTETRSITSMPQEITIKKSLKIVFTDVKSSDRIAINRASATITLENGKERSVSNDTSIKVRYSSKAIIHYYLKGSTESLKPDKTVTGLVGDTFTVSTVKISGYRLTNRELAKTYRFADDIIEITFEYTKLPTPAPEPKPEPNPVTDDGFNPLAVVGLSLFVGISTIFIIRVVRFRRY